MTVVINEFETLGEAPPASGPATSGTQRAAQRAQRRRVRMALARDMRMATT